LILAVRSKGGSIAVSSTTLAVANKGTDDVTLFNVDTLVETARITVGDEPTSVIFSPEGDVVYVVNRASGTVSEITGTTLGRTVNVGSEPTQAALSPTGASLYVANWADGTLAVLNTSTMQVEDVVELGGAPYAVCVTNDGDTDDNDETIFVTDFYSQPIANTVEGTDTSRESRVFRVSANDLSFDDSRLAPLASAGIPGFETSGAFPNQLYSCVVEGGLVYVTSVGASPAAFNNTTDFHQNLQGMISVLDSTTGDEITTETISINALLEQLTTPARFVPVPIDIAFDDDGDAYVASLMSDALVKIDYSANPVVVNEELGAFLATGNAPTGVVIRDGRAFVYNEVSRSVSAIDLTNGTTTTIQSSPLPSDADEQAALRGQQIFHTGLGRWGDNGWVGCGACHAFGTSDNVTWVFPTGPRQSTDTSTTFDATGAVHRIQNWTAVFDEISDVEGNTRGVAGGTGAIVNSEALNEDGSANTSVQIALGANGGNLGSSRALMQTGARPTDWDDVEKYMQTIRSPRGRSTAAQSDVDAGRAIFQSAGCQNCHGGPLWSLSERYYEPVFNSDFSTLSLASQGVANIGAVRAEQVKTTDTSQLFVLQNDANGGGARHTCVVRKVGTFDARGPANRGAAEIRQNGNAAQGVDGFNVPSLLGINMGAPYLHNGAAETLEELLDPNGQFVEHLRSGNATFTPTDQERAQLIAFLRTIDDDTPTIAVPSDQKFCPTSINP
jgi:YVTN family beta-propeller protein